MEKAKNFSMKNLEKNPAYLLNRTLVRLHLSMFRAFKQKGQDITPQQWSVLAALWEQEGLFQAEIAEISNKDNPNVTRILDVMERNKLIFRLPSKEDRRKFKIFLTEEGKDLKKKLTAITAELDKKAYKEISAKDMEIFRGVLNRIFLNLTETEDAPVRIHMGEP